MGTIERYMAYAAAFEEAYASDNWSQLEPFFTEDAAYVNVAPAPFGGEYKGRTAVPTNFKLQRTLRSSLRLPQTRHSRGSDRKRRCRIDSLSGDLYPYGRTGLPYRGGRTRDIQGRLHLAARRLDDRRGNRKSGSIFGATWSEVEADEVALSNPALLRPRTWVCWPYESE